MYKPKIRLVTEALESLEQGDSEMNKLDEIAKEYFKNNPKADMCCLPCSWGNVMFGRDLK
jgi:hypothetical protein